VASVGATLRALRHDGRDLVLPFAADRVRPAMSGAVLAPWPNRTADAAYRFAGARHQLAVNEPETGCAAHGLVAWQDFRVSHASAARVVLTSAIVAQPGYPWWVELEVEFRLDADGLCQRVRATNRGDLPAPFGAGAHPYLLADEPSADAANAWTLEVPAERVLLTDDRMLPTAEVDVAGSDLDFRRRRVIGDIRVNNAFTALTRDEGGYARVRLARADGRGVEMVIGPACPWVQVYTSDAAAGQARRGAVAVEPMSCPPDALNSGRDLRVLPPGGSAEITWAIRALVAGDERAS
jgi:aldose 1-epimerase